MNNRNEVESIIDAIVDTYAIFDAIPPQKGHAEQELTEIYQLLEQASDRLAALIEVKH